MSQGRRKTLDRRGNDSGMRMQLWRMNYENEKRNTQNMEDFFGHRELGFRNMWYEF